jgi:LacI family transcriptional regulator
MGKVTLKDLAKELGVSTTLVSRVLNAKRKEDGTLDCDIGKETAERVLEAAKRLDYQPSRFAAGLRNGKRFLLGVITPDISNYAFSEAGRYIEELAHDDGYSVMFGSSAECEKRMEEILNVFMSQGVDGIIATPCVGSENSLRKVVKRNFPVVLINRDLPSLEGVGRVFLDNILSMKMVVDHFYNNGYRKIEMISEKIEVSSLRDRENSYADTMRSYGLVPHVYHTDSTQLEEQIPAFVREAHAKGTEALITPRIKLSLGSIRAILDMGLRIPHDMAIFCHDESPAFNTLPPTISYVSQCSDQVGIQAYHMLRKMIKGAPGYKVLIPPKLFFGDSTKKK